MNIEQTLLRAYNQRDDLLYDQTVKQVMKRVTDLEQKLHQTEGEYSKLLQLAESAAGNLKCENVHHPKHQRHASTEFCPGVVRVPKETSSL